jgi:hypothetical protein
MSSVGQPDGAPPNVDALRSLLKEYWTTDQDPAVSLEVFLDSRGVQATGGKLDPLMHPNTCGCSDCLLADAWLEAAAHPGWVAELGAAVLAAHEQFAKESGDGICDCDMCEEIRRRAPSRADGGTPEWPQSECRKVPE